MAGLVQPPPPSRRERKRAVWAVLPNDRPAWADAGPGHTAAPKPSLMTRTVAAMGDAWGRFPERMSRVSASKSRLVPFEPAASLRGNGNGSSNMDRQRDR